MTLSAVPLDSTVIGFFRIFATPPGKEKREITMFRGTPVQINNYSTTDPFTESTASITLPQVTLFDTPGQGDLDWLVPDGDIDIIWFNYGAHDYTFSWEGFIVSFNMSMGGTDSSFQIDLKGALYGLDDYLAKPTFPRRPIPYEVLIQNAFDTDEHPCRLKQLKITFPEDWNTKVPEYTGPKYYRSTLKPAGVTPGQKWTGLTARNTGSWEPVLSGFVQSLLSTMFDEGASQWTIRNNGLRRPELYLRAQPMADDPGILEITLGAPGVTVQATKDFTQRANTVYGQGTDEAGIAFAGMAVSPSGSNTFFKPYAWSPLVYPRKNNPSLNRKVKPKETMLRFSDGLDEQAATRVAEGQLQRFADPGFTGSLTLLTDPLTSDGDVFPRMLIKAGTTIRINDLFGMSEGLLVHVTQTTADYDALSVSLNFDSKYRDVLTVDEVQARTRDALSPLRALQVGKFSNTIQDLLFPWSYKEGSGVIPSGGGFNATKFFMEKVPVEATFPWTDWTTKYPPKDYPNYYIKIGKTNTTDSSSNWCAIPRDGDKGLAFPFRMGQSGNIRLTQIAAYDRNGNVLPVRFHVSFYMHTGTGPDAMPEFMTGDEPFLKPGRGVTVNYDHNQSNPFIKDAWEQVLDNGLDFTHANLLPRDNSGFVVGWGNYYEPAGYSPGRFSRGAARTGMLVDETSWAWDLTDNFSKVDRDAPPNFPHSGSLFVEIFCDEQGDEPVFFMGRLYRQEPGAQ